VKEEIDGVLADMRKDQRFFTKYQMGDLIGNYADRIQKAITGMVPAKLVLSVLRAFLEDRSKEEKDAAVNELARYFDENGRDQLSAYVQSMAGLCPTWVPMDETGGVE